METHFTFPDGALAYDCSSCRQRCCRGKGIALAEPELIELLPRAPGLLAHLRLRPGGTLQALNFSDGCWFLQGDGLCALEARHGRSYKPATCRLFPFNRVFRVGDVRVVDVNTLLCPVQAVGTGGVSHAALLDEIEALAGSPLIDAPAAQPRELPADWLARERAAAQAAAEHRADPDRLLGALSSAEAPLSVDEWARLFGLDPAERAALEAQVAPLVALLMPSLRWNRLFHRAAAPYPATLARLPLRLRALTFLGALAARVQGQPPSLRALTELWEGSAPLLSVLERWTEPVRLVSPRFAADLPQRLQPALGTLLAGAFRGGRRLGELVAAAAATLPVAERPLCVALAASQLDILFPQDSQTER
jgi:hypothetical protein